MELLCTLERSSKSISSLKRSLSEIFWELIPFIFSNKRLGRRVKAEEAEGVGEQRGKRFWLSLATFEKWYNYRKFDADGPRFLEDIAKLIDSGTVKYVGQSTIKKGAEVTNW